MTVSPMATVAGQAAADVRGDSLARARPVGPARQPTAAVGTTNRDCGCRPRPGRSGPARSEDRAVVVRNLLASFVIGRTRQDKGPVRFRDS